jgi:hypothetical protein
MKEMDLKNILKAVGKAAAPLLAVMLALGVYDVGRNKRLTGGVVRKYFFGNGLFTWLVSPLNAMLDLLALPYLNKGVYKLDDLPAPYRAEIRKLIDASHRDNLIAKIESTAAQRARTMIFFKWYGANCKAIVDIPAFHEPFRYVQTIGVSVFNKKQQTSKHFGPFRPTLRVLYNINDTHGKDAYIVVGDVTHYWEDEKLFIFDDTLMHQSFNLSEQVRYCLFVDILRPSLLPGVFAAIVRLVQLTLRSVNYIFYKNWDVIDSG